MTEFKLTKLITIQAQYYETKYSWGHKAQLYIGLPLVLEDKIIYQNRTWERYQFQSILFSIIGKAYKNKLITKRQKSILNHKIKNWNDQEYKKEFKTIANIARMGELFGTNQKEKNDWKARMLKAGLENKGLIMPEDWNTLSEDDKQARLDGVINQLSE